MKDTRKSVPKGVINMIKATCVLRGSELFRSSFIMSIGNSNDADVDKATY